MRRLFSKLDLPAWGLMLSLLILSTTLPALTGVVIVSSHGSPELTMNVCQPLQMFSLSPAALLARAAPAAPRFVLHDLGPAIRFAPLPPVDCRKAPDTPPPRLA